MAATANNNRIASATGKAIVDFAANGLFPEDDEISMSYVEGSILSSALHAVQSARHDLEDEIKRISRESAPEVDAWVNNARKLQDDIENTKVHSARIARDADAGDAFYKAVKEDGDYVRFLDKEISYSDQLGRALRGIKHVKGMLDEAETKGHGGHILESLNILAGAWDYIGSVPAHEITRPMSMLSERSFELKASIHDTFDNAWGKLVSFDTDAGSLTVNHVTHGGIDMKQAMTVIEAYKEREARMQNLYKRLDETIIKPRVLLTSGMLHSIVVEGNTIYSSGEPASLLIKDLFLDLEKIVHFISDNFPPEWAKALSVILMPKLTTLVKETWLESSVPVSLEDMTNFRKTIAIVQVFAETITNLGWDGDSDLHEWVDSAPRLWVTKRRETSLDYIRCQLARGIGKTQEVDRTETQIITESEEEQIIPNGDGDGEVDEMEDHGWDAAWSDDGKGAEQKAKAKQSTSVSVSEAPQSSSNESVQLWTAGVAKQDVAEKKGEEDDDGADAWGWGDEDEGIKPVEEQAASMSEEQSQAAVPPAKAVSPAPRKNSQKEVTLTEQYRISSMPDPVFRTIVDIIEDGVILTQEEHQDNPVTAAAVGLFGLPTLVLAMYRAVGPYYYNRASAGAMYCYNDSLYLADQLKHFSSAWSQRTDLAPRAQGKVRLDSEISALEQFGRRAYGAEMSTQRTVITDLLGGAQNFIQEGEAEDNLVAIDSVVARVRELSMEWKPILSKSAWAQAIGALLSTIARKLILDVEDLASLGADEAYRVAKLISVVTKLDELFMPEDKSVPQIPMTSQYAPNWLKLNFLSEVLQSDLKDLQYLWFESDLSVYFLADEVVDLIELSFESNYRTKEAIRKIRENPFPRGVAAEKMV